MLLTEYNEAETMEYLRRETQEIGREEGREEGQEEGRQQGRQILIETCRELGVSIEQTKDKLCTKI